MHLKKSNKKTAAFTASGSETFTQVFPRQSKLELTGYQDSFQSYWTFHW
jgi:hypothetical protein